MEWVINDPEDLKTVADYLMVQLTERRILLLYGDLGAGKTQLVKYLAKSLGSADRVTSPSYSLINEYSYPGGIIYHMDMYRLENTEEAIRIGIEDYLDSGQLCFIEWPGIVEDLVDHEFLEVRLDVVTPNTRKVIV